MTKIVKPESGATHGPTTWRCECGNTQVAEAFALPKNWMTLRIRIGVDGDIIGKQEERTYCPPCAFEFRVGPSMSRARKLLKK